MINIPNDKTKLTININSNKKSFILKSHAEGFLTAAQDQSLMTNKYCKKHFLKPDARNTSSASNTLKQ